MLQKLLYFDTGLLSKISALNTSYHDKESNECLIAYSDSDAHLRDWQNSNDASVELKFLENCGAKHIFVKNGQVEALEICPQDQFNSIDRRGLRPLGQLYSHYNGGGETRSHQDAATSFLNDAAGFPISTFFEDETAAPNATLANTTNRDWESETDRETNSLDWETPGALRTIINGLQPNDRIYLSSIFPEKRPSFEKIVNACMALSMLNAGRSKGIRSRNDKKSATTGEHDLIDFDHIVFGLHCGAFVTNDRPTHLKATIIKDYWFPDAQCQYETLNSH